MKKARVYLRVKTTYTKTIYTNWEEQLQESNLRPPAYGTGALPT